MKVLQKTLITFAMVVGLSLAVFAQKDDPKKPPPKGTPPIVTPQPKPTEPNKPKKPQVEVVYIKENPDGESA